MLRGLGNPMNLSPTDAWEHIAKVSVESNPVVALISIVEPRQMGSPGLRFALSNVTVHLIGGVICFGNKVIYAFLIGNNEIFSIKKLL
jgi:hypothetical protein